MVVRQKLYAKGGIFSITSRILVVDLLTSRFSFLKFYANTGEKVSDIEIFGLWK